MPDREKKLILYFLLKIIILAEFLRASISCIIKEHYHPKWINIGAGFPENNEKPANIQVSLIQQRQVIG
jgi:hypothetical protein